MDFSKLTRMEQIVGVGALVGVVSAFLPWYSASAFGFSMSVNGFTGWFFFSFLGALLALLMVVLPLMKVKLPKIGVEDKVVYLILGGVTAGVPVLALVSGMSQGVGYAGAYGTAGPGIGLFGAIVGGAIIMFAGFMFGKKTVAPSEPEVPNE